jgi:hypothetical protein
MGKDFTGLRAGQAAAATDWRDPEDIITAKDVGALRRDVRDMLMVAKATAKNAGKPLHILIGEDHDDNRALLKEIVTIDEARRIGIRTLGVEMPLGGIIHSAPEGGVAAHFASLETIGNLFPNMKNVPLDTGRPVKEETAEGAREILAAEAIAYRSAAMARNIAAQPGDTISIVGLDHVPQIVADPAMGQSVTLAFDASNTIDVQDKIVYGKPDSGNAVDLPLSGDAREYSYAELVKLGLGPARAKPLLAKMEAAGLANSPGGVKASIATLEQKWDHMQMIHPELLELSNAYGELYKMTGNADFAARAADRYSLYYAGNKSDPRSAFEGALDCEALLNAPRAVRESPYAAKGLNAVFAATRQLDQTSPIERLLSSVKGEQELFTVEPLRTTSNERLDLPPPARADRKSKQVASRLNPD